MPADFRYGKHKTGSDHEDDEEDNASDKETADRERYEAKPEEIERPREFDELRKGGSPVFGALVLVLDRLERGRMFKDQKLQNKYDLLNHFYNTYRETVGPDLYPVIRLLLPDRDTRRRNYSLKEAKLALAIGKALSLDVHSGDFLKLKAWKTPGTDGPQDGAGDLGAVVFHIMERRSAVMTEYGSMTIDDINSTLDELSKVGRGFGAAPGVKKVASDEHARILRAAISKMKPTEIKWLVRIILRDLKVGVSERTVLSAMHPDAMEQFNSCSDILRVCWSLWDTNYRCPREDKDVKLGRPFLPMLCYRNMRNLSDIVKMMMTRRKPGPEPDPSNPYFCNPDEFLVEEKLDGERLLMHKMGDSYRWFSRTSKDYTYAYGQDASQGSLVPFLKDCFIPEIEDLVLDGEVLVWHPVLQKYLAFGQLKSFFNKPKYDENDLRPCYKVFDVLYARTSLGEINFLEIPLYKRKQFLSQILKPKKGVIELAEVTKASTAKDLSKYLSHIVEERGEGLVIKHPLANYILGGREQTQIKLKPEYVDELADSIEAVVIGGYWGGGNRGGFHASFLLGVRGSLEDPTGTNPAIFTSFAKVGSGFTLEAYEMIKREMRGRWADFDRKKPPFWLRSNGELPDQVIHPEESFIVDVKAAEIVPGNDYGAGLTLRFPRARRILSDKTWEDAKSVADLFAMMQKTKKREGNHDLTAKKKARVSKSTDRTGYLSAPIRDVNVSSTVFKGLTFYVHNFKPSDPFSKDELQKKILEGGGKYIQRVPATEGASGLAVAAEWKGLRQGVGTKNNIEKVDVVSASWIVDSLEQNRLMPRSKSYVLNPSPATLESAEYTARPASPKRDEAGRVSMSREDASTTSSTGIFANGEPSTIATQAEAREAFSDDADSSVRDSESEHVESEPEEELEEAHYDPDKPFGPPLLFYFDTSVNAALNQLEVAAVPSPAQVIMDQELRDTAQRKLVAIVARFQTDAMLHAVLKAHDAQITDNLAHPSLTHIIMHLNNRDRFKEILHRTSEPRYRKIVTHEWVKESVAEGDILDEIDYKA